MLTACPAALKIPTSCYVWGGVGLGGEICPGTVTSCLAALNILTSCYVWGAVGWGEIITSWYANVLPCCSNIPTSCYIWGGFGWGNNVLLRQATVTLYPVYVLLNILHKWCTVQPVLLLLYILDTLTYFTSDVRYNLFYWNLTGYHIEPISHMMHAATCFTVTVHTWHIYLISHLMCATTCSTVT